MISTQTQEKEEEKLTIQKLLLLVRSYGFNVRSSNKKGDIAWTLVKNLLIDIDSKLKMNEWNQQSKHFYPYMKNTLQLYGDTIIDPDTNKEQNDNPDHSIWEPHHFLLQHGRIVQLSEPSLLRLVQVNYNSGQLLAQMVMDKNAYTQDQRDYIQQGEIYDISSYITVSDAEILNNIIQEREISEILRKVIKVLYQIDSIPSNR